MSAPLAPSTNLFPSTDLAPSQGLRPIMVARLGFESARTADPLAWVDVSGRVRAFEISRGTENELDQIDAGTASVVLDNRDRALDPFNTSSPYSPNVKPRRRLWLQSQWDGQTVDQFYGWAGGFRPDWPSDFDQVASVAARDGLMILAGDALPTSNPPRDSYADVVLFDLPRVYTRFGDIPQEAGNAEIPNLGSDSGVIRFNGFGLLPDLVDSLVVGDHNDKALMFNGSTEAIAVLGGSVNGEGAFDLTDYTQWSFECLLNMPTFTSGHTLAAGPAANNGTASGAQWAVSVTSGGLLQATLIPTAGAAVTVTGATALPLDATVHLAVVHDATHLRLYVDGVQDAALANTSALDNPTSSTSSGQIGAAINGNSTADEFALYQYALPADRVAAHAEAALHMGHHQARTDEHITVALEESGLAFIPRRLRAGQRDIQAVYFTGQSPRTWWDDAVVAEGDPALAYIAKDGAAVFLDRNHRTASPWDTVQATFDDQGGGVAYVAVEPDDGEAFIHNDVRITPKGGTLQRTLDEASITEYDRIDLTRETLNVSDADAEEEADALLAKYKSPLPRITALELAGEDPDQLTQMLNRELGDRIRVKRQPNGTGVAIDQTSFIRKITLRGDNETSPYWSATFAVSPR